jgi:hypothetical protein
MDIQPVHRRDPALSGGGFYTVGTGYTTLINGNLNYDAMIMKFNADGSLDETFGAGTHPADGCVTWNYGDMTLSILAAAMDGSGRIVICGYNSDTGHGIMPGSTRTARSIHVQRDERIRRRELGRQRQLQVPGYRLCGKDNR